MEKKIYWNIWSFLFFAGALFAGFLVYSNLDKGLIFNDEVFYLFHFREFKNIITVDATNFFRIFQPFYTDNIYHFRIITYLLLNASTFLLFFFTAKFFKLKMNPFLLGFLGITYNFIAWPASNIVLHQYIGNTILVNFSLLFLLISIHYKKKYLLVASGFFLGILLFDGIPHVTVFVPIGLFLLFIFGRNEKPKILLFALGVLLAIVYYFVAVQSFSNFISQLEYLKIYQTFHIKQHPKSFFFYWFAKVIGFIFLPAFLICGAVYRFSGNKIKNLDIILTVLLGGYLLSLLFFPSGYFNYFFLLVLLFRFFLSEKTAKEKAFIATFFLIPFCLSFGSGAYFGIRSAVYSIYYILSLVIIISTIYPLRIYAIFVIIYLSGLYSFPDFTKTKDWKDFIFAEQNVPVQINGHPIYLDKYRNKDIEDLRPYLLNQSKVIYSNNHLMGYLFILNAKPPLPYYFTLKKYVLFYMEKNGDSPDDYIYLESDDYPFSPKEFVPLGFVKYPDKYQTVQAGRFTLYLPQNFQKK
jgi:hypothetical protein